jgi:predicted transcriptional regulator
MNATNHQGLSRRERQILDILYQRGQATAAEVQKALTKKPSYSADRALLRNLEVKEKVNNNQENNKMQI